MFQYLLGSPTNTWGRTWNAGEFNNSNFRVRVANVASSKSRDFFLDWVSVKLYFDEPPKMYYLYDPLNRLTEASYNDGDYFHYSYDAVGNRLAETTLAGSTTYEYDIANRLTSVDGVIYTWDNNGNLLNDGANTYTYDHANRLSGVTGTGLSASYSYNGLGDRLRQVVDGQTTDFSLDLNRGMTQVLSDGSYTYLYGHSRLGQESAAGMEYYLTDALGSVRQLADASSVTLSRAYEPYGEVLDSSGSGTTSYGFTGEWTDSQTGLIYLRARHYAPGTGRFMSRDLWQGSARQPMSYNAWLYVYDNPVNIIDPTGLKPPMPPIPPTYPPAPDILKLPAVCAVLHRTVNDECLGICKNALGNSDWLYVGKRRISGYFVVHEEKFPISDGYGIYDVQIGGERVSARERFLFRNDGVCMNGTGRLKDGRYINCVESVNWTIPDDSNFMPSKSSYDDINFSFTARPSYPKFSPFKTVAKYHSGIFADPDIRSLDTLFIPSLTGFLAHWDSSYQGGLLTVTDVGGGLGQNNDDIYALDLFLGEDQPYGRDAYIDLKNCLTPNPNSPWYNWPDNSGVCAARPLVYHYVDVYAWRPE